MELRLPQDPAYRKLHSSRSAAGWTSYWLAADHLLVVETVAVSERYRRFELRDLELLVIRPNSWRLIASLVLSPLLLLFLGLAIWTGFESYRGSTDATVGFVLCSIPTVILTVSLAVVVLPGQFCTVTLRSGVQTLTLAGLSRLRRAERFAAALREAAAALPREAAAPTPTSSPSGTPSGASPEPVLPAVTAPSPSVDDPPPAS